MHERKFEVVGTKPNDGIFVPLKANKEILGALGIQNYITGMAYTDQDVQVLTFVAQHIATALTRVRAIETERQRAAELAIINSIQQGLAAELDFQAIVDLVGDKLREVFDTPDLVINWYDEEANLLHYLYEYEHGKRLTTQSFPPLSGGLFETMTKTRQPIVLNNTEDYLKLNMEVVSGTDQSKSIISVPVISSDRVLGIIQIENYERENAFGESELRLLTTIAASLGTALENARLFEIGRAHV